MFDAMDYELRQFCFSHFIRINDFVVNLQEINLDFSTCIDGVQTTAGTAWSHQMAYA